MLPNRTTRSAFFYALLLCVGELHAQQAADTTGQAQRRFREYKRFFQISLFPGISTNGVASGFYYNKISINLFGGVSAGNRLIEIGALTNNSFKKSNGIQLAGMANIIGANAFVNLTLSEERKLVHSDFACTYQGIQVAGILNYVLDDAKGIQISGGLNTVGGHFEGVQLAVIGNSAGGTSIGVHIAGMYNVVHQSVAGIQISSLFNFTDEELSGTQIGIINKARWIRGKRSTPPSPTTGLQLGIINFSREMDGTQIGLINFGGATRGKQVGLINFFQRLPSKDPVYMGTPIGILNLGSYGSYLRIYYNELFSSNIEYTTGNCVNCTWTQSTQPYWDLNKKQNQNALIAGYDHWRKTWGFGYGFQKVLYKKSSMNPKDKENGKRIISYGARFIHLNRALKLDRDFNLLTRLNFDWGMFKWGKAYRSYYWFVGVSINYFMHEELSEGETFQIQSLEIPAGRLFGLETKLWPGYNIGIQL